MNSSQTRKYILLKCNPYKQVMISFGFFWMLRNQTRRTFSRCRLQVYDRFRDTLSIDFAPSHHWSPIIVRRKPKIRCDYFFFFNLAGFSFCHSRTNYDSAKYFWQTVILRSGGPPNKLYIVLCKDGCPDDFCFDAPRIVLDFSQLPSCPSENCSRNRPLAIFLLKWRRLWALSEPTLAVGVTCAIECVTK